jgi:hypothetical protein
MKEILVFHVIRAPYDLLCGYEGLCLNCRWLERCTRDNGFSLFFSISHAGRVVG